MKTKLTHQTAENCQYCCWERTDRKVQMFVREFRNSPARESCSLHRTSLNLWKAQTRPAFENGKVPCQREETKEEFPKFKEVKNIG